MQEISSKSEYKRALKEKILDVAIGMFVERGIKGVKMDDVAAALSISKRTVYEIYEDKGELLFECVKKSIEAQLRRYEKIVGESTDVIDIIMKSHKLKMEQCKNVNPDFYDDLDKYPEIIEYLRRDSVSRMDKFVCFLKRGVAEGYFRNDLNLQLVGKMFDFMPEMMRINKLHTQYSAEEIFHNIVFLAVRGLCTVKGLQALDNYDKTH